MNDNSIAIIGGGIGGLAVAAALSKSSHRTIVYERREHFNGEGAGIALFANAMRALHSIGVDKLVATKGNPIDRMTILTCGGKILFDDDTTWHRTLTGHASVMIHRADLHAALRAAVPTNSIHMSHALCEIEETDQGVELGFESGRQGRANLVIAADGLHSVVRDRLWKDGSARYAGQRCWRGVVSLSAPLANTLAVVQGGSLQFGMAPLSPGSLYWFAKYPGSEEGGPRNGVDSRLHLASLFNGWALGISEIIASTDPNQIIRTDLYDRPPLRQWSRRSTALLGDAAHPMLPSLGQGGAMAIEDAVVLGKQLRSECDFQTACKRYERERQTRTRRMATQARRMSQISACDGLLATIRDAIIPTIPKAVYRHGTEWQIGGGPHVMS